MPQAAVVPAVGITIPDIVLTSPDRKRSRLSAVQDGARAVVFFMRAADCPLCLAHVRRINRMIDDGELRGAKFIVVAPGDAEDAKKAERRIASSNASVWASGTQHADVGLGKFLLLQHSGTFLVDHSGIVEYSKTAAMPTGSFSHAELVAALSR
jgi:peroxiredoxin